jgi:hypothetical protein
MTQQPILDSARRLWTRNGGGTSSPEEVGAATIRVCTQLRTGLTRWVGAEGYRALLERALELAAEAHPALRNVPCDDGDQEAATAAARAHGAAEVATGVVALVGTVTELLGRIIGEDMAVQLMEQTGTPGRRRKSPTSSAGVQDA